MLDCRGGRRVGGKKEEGCLKLEGVDVEGGGGRMGRIKASAFDLIGAVEELDRGWRLLIKRIVGLIVDLGERRKKNTNG